MPELFNCYPSQIRQQFIDKYKGYKVVLFPAAYFRKAPGSMSPLWVNVCAMDKNGIVGKTNQNDRLLSKLIGYLDKMEIEYEVIIV